MYKRLEGKFLSPTFAEKVNEFITFATTQDNVVIDGVMKCPCAQCRNIPYQDLDTIKEHLYRHGFLPNYFQWVFHGELHFQRESQSSSSISTEDALNPYRNMVLDAFGLEGGLENIEEEPHASYKKFFDMLKAAEEPLYDGCKLSVLSAAARMANIKCEYNIPHKAIDGVASLMKDMCPDENKMTNSFYKTKKLLEGLELPHQKIHVCPNGCMLFWKEHKDLKECLYCKGSRYKTLRESGNNSPHSALIYFPVGPRLQRLYATRSTAEQMRWHKDNPRVHGLMSHPSDEEAWKHLDEEYPSFAAEPRNVRLGLCTDGFSPFGKTGRQYSCWPVILTPYNLPPELCMKKPFMFLSLIIPGPKNPKGNLDVYLQPLIEELKQLWEVGLPTYDISQKQNFQLKAALLWTISDFPAYGMLSGWTTSGRLACPYCMENTKAFTLKNGGKQSWFDCHRQFLPHDHNFRKNKSAFFKDRVENDSPPPRMSGEDIWNRVSLFPKTVEQIRGDDNEAEGYGKFHHWTKQSVFWELPYWSKLLIRHNLDVMHIEKNVFDNVFHTVMDVKGKTKDNVKARRDLGEYCKRRKLEAQDVVNSKGEKRTLKPNAPFVLPKEKRKLICEWVKKLKFPDGYASNLGRCVDLKECKLFGMKSHDCHVFMQRLLPAVFKDLLPLNVWNVITELSQFFRDLCSTTLKNY